MGCGASSNFNEDGSIVPGKGETSFKLASKMPTYFTFTDSGASNVSMKLRKIIAGQEALKEKYSNEGIAEAGGNSFWAEVEEGSYMQAYVVNGASVTHPGGVSVDIPVKVHKEHEADKEKFTKNIKKEHEKKEDHPYNAPDGAGDAKLEEDMQSLKDKITVHDCPDDFGKLKEALVIMEDNMPMNTCNAANISVDHGLGYFDKGEPVLGLKEKAMKAAQPKMKNPGNLLKVVSKKDDVSKMAVMKAMDGACSGIKVKREEFLPTLELALDIQQDKRPGATKKEPAEGEDANAEELEEQFKTRVEKQWAYDKDKLKQWESEDQDTSALKSKIEARAKETLEACSGSAPSSGDCVAFCRGVYAAATANGGGNYTWPETKDMQSESASLGDKTKLKVIRGIEEKEEEFDSAAPLPPAAKFEDLMLGDSVIARRKDGDSSAFYTCVITYIDHDDKKVWVKDRFMEEFCVESDCCYWAISKEGVARRGWRIPTNFFEIEVNYACAEDSVQREFTIWREGAKDETTETVTLEKKMVKAKPTKDVPEPTHEVFVGYTAKVKVLPYRVYNFFWKVGDDVEMDFGTKVESGDGYKRLTVTF